MRTWQKRKNGMQYWNLNHLSTGDTGDKTRNYGVGGGWGGVGGGGVVGGHNMTGRIP